MYDRISECKSKEINGLILLIDFEKAFDSLPWVFMIDSLTKFYFGEKFIKWIKIFLNGAKSRIILNGHPSDPFKLERGCPQGDPFASNLFILSSLHSHSNMMKISEV